MRFVKTLEQFKKEFPDNFEEPSEDAGYRDKIVDISPFFVVGMIEHCGKKENEARRASWNWADWMFTEILIDGKQYLLDC